MDDKVCRGFLRTDAGADWVFRQPLLDGRRSMLVTERTLAYQTLVTGGSGNRETTHSFRSHWWTVGQQRRLWLDAFGFLLSFVRRLRRLR